MKVPRVARRTVAACVADRGARAAAAQAATQQEVNAGVAAGAAWLRTQQNPATGQITGFGGDYALSALAAAGVHAADVHGPERPTRRAGLLRRPVVGADDAELDRDPVRLRGRDRRAAAVGLHQPGGAARDGVQPHRRARGLVCRRRDEHHGVQRSRARSCGRAAGRVGQAQRLPPRAAAHRRRLELRPRGHGRPARRSEQRRHDRRRAGGPVRDGSGSDRSRRPRRRLVPRGAPGPGDRWVRERRLDRVGGVGDTCVRDRPAGRAADDGRVAGRPSTTCSPSRTRAGRSRSAARRTCTRRRTRSGRWQERASRPTRRGARQPATRAFAPRRSSPTGPPTPHVLALDDGEGDVRLCSVTAPAGASLAAFLAAALGIVAGRLRHVVRDRGALVTEVNGREGGWRLRLNRAPEQAASESRAIAFGDTVFLRRPSPAGGSQPLPSPGRAALRVQRGPPAQRPAGPRGRSRAPRSRHVHRALAAPRVLPRVGGAGSRARLMRGGRVVATGTPTRLRTRHAIRPGRYTLRLAGGRELAVTVR